MSAPKEAHLNERIDRKWLFVRDMGYWDTQFFWILLHRIINVNERTRQRLVTLRQGLVAQGRNAYFLKRSALVRLGKRNHSWIANDALRRRLIHSNFYLHLYSLIAERRSDALRHILFASRHWDFIDNTLRCMISSFNLLFTWNRRLDSNDLP